MKAPYSLLALALCGALQLHAQEEKPAEYRLAPTRDFPSRPWQAADKEAESWKGPFAPALKLLLEAGLPDPAGLPYHQIGITTGNCYSGFDGIIETEGWLLPKKEGEPAFAIAWNGLIYPVEGDKGEADLKATVERVMKPAKDERNRWFDTGERTQASANSMSLIHGLYLTRLGYPEAAEKLVENQEDFSKRAPLLEGMAGEWTWNLYERAVCAHMRGDPKMALASLAAGKQAVSALEKKIKPEDAQSEHPFPWSEDMPALEKECERRVKEGKIGLFDEKAFLGKEHSTLELIDAFDRIAMMQSGQPGDVPLWESEVVKALVAKGAGAVEPLLQCLENDMRFTQSVHFWRDFAKDRTVLGVHEAAIYALQELLEADFFQLASTGDSLSARDPQYRKKLAAVVRANWEKYGKTTGPARSFRILQDDAAGIDAWMQAGNALLPKTEYDEESGKRVPAKGPMPGEPLRGKQKPSVSDLLEKRAAEAGKQGDAGDEDAGHGRMALLAILLEWDQARGRAAIGKLTAHWLENGVWSSEKKQVLQQFIQEVVDKAPEILPVFEAMAWDLAPGEYGDGFGPRADFITAMYLKHGEALKRKGLWTDPESPWCTTKLKALDLEDLVGSWKEKELLDKTPFRELVAALLKDDSECAEVFEKEDSPGYWWYRGDEDRGGTGLPENDPKVGLKPGKSLPVRRKDVAAKAIKDSRYMSDKPQEPVLQYYWSIKDRDEWVAKVGKEFNAPPKAKEEPKK